MDAAPDIWRLSQAKFGNGPYTLRKEQHETATSVWEEINVNSIHQVSFIADRVGHSCQHPHGNAKTVSRTSNPLGLERGSSQTRFQVGHRAHVEHVRMDC
eukprot:5211342-Amphidinium_carterae.2